MKKLLFQIDTDPIPAVFDTVVAYDGGADHVTAHGGITPDNVGPLVDSTIDDKPLSVALHEINDDKLILKPLDETPAP